MPKEFYTHKIVDKVVRTALEAARASGQGKRSITLGKGTARQQFDLRETSMCAKFVRQVYETACGFGKSTWAYRGANAREMTAKLGAGGHAVHDGSLIPGDILGIHRGSGRFGHIAIYVGKVDGVESIAENTSSRSRGNPRRAGTKLTPYSEIESRVTGVYRLLAGEPEKKWPGFRSFLQVGSVWKEIVPAPNGDHRLDQGKAYWRLKS